MKLISVQSRGNRLVKVKQLDSRFWFSRTNLFTVERIAFVKPSEYGVDRLISRLLRYKHESTALKAAEQWLKGASDGRTRHITTSD